MSGAYHRSILLTRAAGGVVAELEDDFHRFDVSLHHDGRRVTEITTSAHRYPWSTCPAAAGGLESLVGLELDATPALSHSVSCTHIVDLTVLAMRHASADRDTRRYDVRVPDRFGKRTRAQLLRDGAPLLEWDVVGGSIAGPAPFAGFKLRDRSFSAFIRSELDADTAEAAGVLRRALDISLGRGRDLDPYPSAEPLAEILGPVCYSFQPEIAPTAGRMVGTGWDWSAHPDLLLTGERSDPARQAHREDR